MIDLDDLTRVVAAFSDSTDGSSRKSQELTLHLLKHTEAPLARSQFIPGHVTATGLVIHPGRNAILLIHHRRLNRWLLPGGHVEPEDLTIFDTAAREVIEETGVQLHHRRVAPLIGLDVHAIPPGKGEPLHYHHDLIFGFRAESQELMQAAEVLDARWFGLQSLPSELPDNIRLGLARALAIQNM